MTEEKDGLLGWLLASVSVPGFRCHCSPLATLNGSKPVMRQILRELVSRDWLGTQECLICCVAFCEDLVLKSVYVEFFFQVTYWLLSFSLTFKTTFLFCLFSKFIEKYH